MSFATQVKPRIAGDPLLLPCRVVLHRCVISNAIRFQACSSHIDIAQSIKGNAHGSIIQIRGPVVVGDPLLLPRRVVFDCKVIVTSATALAAARYKDVARNINGNADAVVIQIRRSIVASNPLLLPCEVVLDRDTIKTAASASAAPCHVNVACAINDGGLGGIVEVRRSVVTGNPLFLPV